MTTLIEKMVGDLDDRWGYVHGWWTGGTEHDSSLSAVERGIYQETRS